MLDSKQKIMEATHTVLSKEGYSDMSVRKIAEEAGKDKSLIYHHYGSKKNLILSFIDCIKDAIDEEYEEIDSAPENYKLEKLLNTSFNKDNEKRWQLERAFLEIQAQASHDKVLSSKLQELDKHFKNKTKSIFEDLGAKEPETTAELYLSLTQGINSRKAALQEKEGLKALKDETEKIIANRIN